MNSMSVLRAIIEHSSSKKIDSKTYRNTNSFKEVLVANNW